MYNPQDVFNLFLKSADGKAYFDQKTRFVSFGETSESIENTHMSIHESMHEYLNHATIYGAVMQAYFYLYRNTDEEAYANMLGSLVNRSRIVHEVYATFLGSYTSWAIDKYKGSPVAFVGDNQEYLGYFQIGEELTKSFSSHLFKNIALNAALYACMATKNLVLTLLNNGFADFELSMARAMDFPNKRLDRLLRLNSSTFWEACLSGFQAKYPDSVEIQAILEVEKRGGREDFWKEGEEIQAAYAYFYEYVCKQLDGDSFSAVYEEHLILGQQLMHCAYRVVPLAEAKEPMISFLDANINREEAMSIMLENEKLYFSEHKQLAQLYLLSEIEQGDWHKLLSGVEPEQHYWMVYRTVEQLLQHYEMDSESLGKLSTFQSEGVHLIKQRVPYRLEGQSDIYYFIKLVIIEQSKDMEQFILHNKVKPIISNVSFRALAEHGAYSDTIWNHYLDKHTSATILLDISLEKFRLYCLDKFQNRVGEGAAILYGYIQLELGLKVFDALIFTEVEDKNIFIALCSRTASSAFYEWTSRQTRDVFAFSKDILATHPEKFAIIASLSHILKEDYFFSMD